MCYSAKTALLHLEKVGRGEIRGHEKGLYELEPKEFLDKVYDPVKAVTTEPMLFRDEDGEKDEKGPFWYSSFIRNFEAEQARENKENDLLGAKDYEKILERENQKKEEIRKSKEKDLPGYRPWEKKYEFRDYYDQKQIFSDSMAFRLGVSQEKLDEIKKEAETKDKSNVLTATFNSGGATTSAAITGGLDILLGKPLQTLGWKNNPISVVNNYYQNLSKKKYNTMMKEVDETGLGKPMEYAARFSSSLVSAIPTAIIAYLSAGTSLAAQGGSAISSILSNPAFWYSFETSLYPEYQNALMNGATENEATIVATMASLFDAGIEVGGGIERLPKIMQNPGTRNKILKNWVKVAIDEGNESVLQDMTSELTQKIIFDHGKDWVSFDKDNNAVLNVPKSLENWLTSAAIGGILSGPLSVKSILSKNAADFAEYESFKKKLGNNAPKTFADFRELKYNSGNWYDYNIYADSIQRGELTPFADFNLYKQVCKETDSLIVGQTVGGGVKITMRSHHFTNRVIGSESENRSGVEVKDILKTLKTQPKYDKEKDSFVYVLNGVCKVTVNPYTGKLIQVNPLSSKKEVKK